MPEESESYYYYLRTDQLTGEQHQVMVKAPDRGKAEERLSAKIPEEKEYLLTDAETVIEIKQAPIDTPSVFLTE